MTTKNNSKICFNDAYLAVISGLFANPAFINKSPADVDVIHVANIATHAAEILVNYSK